MEASRDRCSLVCLQKFLIIQVRELVNMFPMIKTSKSTKACPENFITEENIDGKKKVKTNTRD